MKVFYAPVDSPNGDLKVVAIISAYNRGHAVNLLKKSLKNANEHELAEDVKSIPVTELLLDDKKGTVVFQQAPWGK